MSNMQTPEEVLYFNNMREAYQVGQYQEIYVTQKASPQEMLQLGFKWYPVRPIRRWVRTIGVDEALKIVKTSWTTLSAPQGYFMVYNVESYYSQNKSVFARSWAENPDLKFNRDPRIVALESILDFWPVRPDVFAKTYSMTFVDGSPLVDWDDINNRLAGLNEIETQIVNIGGFFPVTKKGGVWGKQVSVRTGIQGIEHRETGSGLVDQLRLKTVNHGDMLLIGIDGEPYDMSTANFMERYDVNNPMMTPLW